LAAVALALGGCASAHAPLAYQQTPAQAESTAYGGWISLEGGEEHPRVLARGELIAVQDDSVFVLGDSGCVVVRVSDVKRGRFEAYHPATGGMVAWTLLGTLSTASHGAVAVISAPVWILVGSITTGYASRSGTRPVSPQQNASWKEIAAYSRFPEGLPPELDWRTLRQRGTPRP
jgi:hypothetical protein